MLLASNSFLRKCSVNLKKRFLPVNLTAEYCPLLWRSIHEGNAGVGLVFLGPLHATAAERRRQGRLGAGR